MRWLLLFINIVIIYTASAQKIPTNKKAQQAFELATKHLRLNELNSAVENLEKAILADPSFATAFQQLADIYRKQEKYKFAIEKYLKVLSLDPNLTSLTYFGIGESYFFTGEYEKALQYFELYRKSKSLTPKSEALLNKYITDCTFALANIGAPNLLTIKKLPNAINSPMDEYFPQLTADNKTLIFTRKENNQENFYESIFTDDNWSETRKLTGAINSDQFNEGAHCISPDGKYLFFTGCNRPDGLGSCDIYVSKKENGRWSSPRNLGSPINTRGWEAQPSISADGKTLFFVSNRTGGFGGYDLYKSQLAANGQWSIPINLGPNINTPFNESAPYIHADNQTLYFSSDGWPGFGHKDIFKSTLDSANNWSTPQNLGNQVNDFREQMSMHVSMNGRIAHLATQDTFGNFDIYSFELAQNSRPKAVAYILGTVLDARTKTPIDATVSVTNIHNQQVVYKNTSDKQDGSYLATLPIGQNYAVHIQKEGYLFDSKQYSLENEKTANEQFIHTTLLSPIALGNLATLNNIYFGVNKFELLPASISELKLLVDFMKTNPKAHIEIAGHTDNTGSKSINQTLSENRANAVVKHLIENEIAAYRLQSKGYGDSLPIAPNDTEAGRQQNRRTEFKIVKL